MIYLERAVFFFFFVIYSLSRFLISRLILILIQGCLSLILAVLCGMNLLMALFSSDVILFKSWFTGFEKLKFHCKLLPSSEI